MRLADLRPDSLHHAYLVLGEREAAEREVRACIEGSFGMKIGGNPDVAFEHFETWGVDAARELKDRASSKGISGGRRVFVVSFAFITVEAQNALLKLLEEPIEGAVFFLLTPSAAPLLPTLQSRLERIDVAVRPAEALSAAAFLAAGPDERLKLAQGFKDADNETKKSELLAFMGFLESSLAPRAGEPGIAAALREILALKGYLFDRAPSTKMISEYLALRLPRIPEGKDRVVE